MFAQGIEQGMFLKTLHRDRITELSSLLIPKIWLRHNITCKFLYMGIRVRS